MFTTLLNKNEGKRIKIIAMILMLFSSVVFSQIDNVTTGYYRVYQNGKYISQHSSQSKADVKIGMLQEQYPDSNNYYSHPTNTRAVGVLKVIDTIQLIRVRDLKGWIDHTGEQTIAYLPFYNNGVVEFQADSIYNWQSKYNFKRTKTFGKVSYENLTIPFQIVDIWIDKTDNSTYAVNLTTTEYPKQTSCYLNGELYKQFTPGSFRKDSEFEYFGIWGLYNLDAAIDYEVKTVVEGVDGGIMTSIINIIR